MCAASGAPGASAVGRPWAAERGKLSGKLGQGPAGSSAASSGDGADDSTATGRSAGTGGSSANCALAGGGGVGGAGGQGSAGGAGGPRGGGADGGKAVLERVEIGRALTRIAHEILERTKGAGDVVLLGIPTRGVPLARRVAERIAQVEGHPVPWGSLDITMYRDDLRLRPTRALGPTKVPAAGIEGRTVIIVDDVPLFGQDRSRSPGRAQRHGRPRAVQLATLVDRGHRELPIRADYVGKNLPTSQHEVVRVLLEETDGEDIVLLVRVRRPPIGARIRLIRVGSRVRIGALNHWVITARYRAVMSAQSHRVLRPHRSPGSSHEPPSDLSSGPDQGRRPAYPRYRGRARADGRPPDQKLPTLRGRTVVNLFFEDSTRTRISFEAAAERLPLM